VTDYGHRLEFGTFVTPSAAHSGGVLDLVLLAERSGLDLVTVQDHPYQPRFLDAWTLLSFLAARTERVHLAPDVANLPLRQPAVLARAAAGLDILSGGRVSLGLGAAAFWDAIEAMGGRRLAPGQAVQAMSEAIDVIRGVWDVDGAGPLAVDGEFYRLRGAKRGPRPPHAIPLWVGAGKPKMLSLIGAKADGWLPTLERVGAASLPGANAIIDAAALAHGRLPRDVRRLLNVAGEFGAGAGAGPGVPSGRLRGRARQWAEELAALALGNGVGTFILASDDRATTERFAHEVVPAVRELVAAARPAPGPGTGA
jgi:alkanesulfonate monooxygenase SsuD/methylene tetrahydromethanopterin reductase-like flavin-dependent oxidoreductase (luciferase family)